MGKEIRVGFIVALAIVIVVFGLRWLGGWRVGSERQEVELEFSNGGGLKRADRVLARGVFKGRVDDVRLTEHGVLVRVWIESDVILKEDASAEIETIGLLGGSRVLIEPGQSEKLYDFSRPIAGGSGADLGTLMVSASRILETTDEMLKTISNELLSADDLERLRRIMSTLDEGTKDFKSSASELKKMLRTNGEAFARSMNQIESVTQSLDSLLVSLQSGKGTAGKLLSDDELYEELVNGITELRELIEDIKTNPRKYFRLF
jgi:phospholipid/cholesterol/gamma-HCH transport system substrate-binding protein